MEADTYTPPGPSPTGAYAPVEQRVADPGSAVHVYVKNLTARGTFTAQEVKDLVWGLHWQALYEYNRSPWVERGYSQACADVVLLAPNASVPSGGWLLELLDSSDQEGALGYHEDQAFDVNSSGPRKSSQRSSRGLASGTETPLAKVFCKTSILDGVAPSEVASHELLEMLVDPQVVQESEIRKYLNIAAKEWYIGEVGDPVQGEGYPLGNPAVRTVTVANFAWPAWFGAAQTRKALDQRGTRKEPFELAPGGYMSVSPEAEPSNWSQIWGAAHRG